MNLRKLVVLSVSALAVLGSSLAEARPGYRNHQHHGGSRAWLYAAPFIAAGAYLASRPYYRPYYAPAPTYYYRPAPAYYSAPPVYIEQAPRYSVPPQQQYEPQQYEPQQYEPQQYEPQQYEPQQYEPQQYEPQPQSRQQYSVPPQPQAQPQQDSSWFYCASSQAYYPNVQTCSEGWQRTAPQR